jgi:hypothetical protein
VDAGARRRLNAIAEIARAANLARFGNPDSALLVIHNLKSLWSASTDAADYNSLCWWQALRGERFARQVLPLCNRAVALAPNEIEYIDSRGLARGVVGERDGALADLTAVLKDTASFSGDRRAIRERWTRSIERRGRIVEEDLRQARQFYARPTGGMDTIVANQDSTIS